jgi:hypothetical protein
LVKPWSNTTDGTGDYIYKNANTICKSTAPKGEAKKLPNPFQGLTLEQVANGFRDAMSGVGGSIAQIVISLFGGHVINMVAWGLLVAYDIYSWVQKGVVNWFNLLNDLIWLLLAGVGGKIMGALKPILKGETKLINIFTKASKTTWWSHLKLFLTKISSYGSKVILQIRQAISAIINKVPTLKSLLNPLLGIINRVGGVLTRIEQTFVEFSKIKPVMKVAKVVKPMVKPVTTVAKVLKPMVKPVVKVAKEYVKGDIQSRVVNTGLNAGFGKT